MAEDTRKWIQAAHLKKGALGRQAKRAGYSSWREYCESGEATALGRKRCATARTLSKLAKRRKKKTSKRS